MSVDRWIKKAVALAGFSKERGHTHTCVPISATSLRGKPISSEIPTHELTDLINECGAHGDDEAKDATHVDTQLFMFGLRRSNTRAIVTNPKQEQVFDKMKISRQGRIRSPKELEKVVNAAPKKRGRSTTGFLLRSKAPKAAGHVMAVLVAKNNNRKRGRGPQTLVDSALDGVTEKVSPKQMWDIVDKQWKKTGRATTVSRVQPITGGGKKRKRRRR